MDLAALRSALQLRLGLPSVGDGLLPAATQTAIINAALRDLCQERDWPWLVTSAALTFTSGDATVPSGFVRAREVTINSRPAKYLPLTEFLAAQADRSVYAWTDIGTTIRLTPTPATAPTLPVLYYVRAEPELTSDTDEPLLPEPYHDVLVARAAYRANVRRNRMDESVRDDNEYQLGVRKMKDAGWARAGQRSVRRSGSVLWARW